MLSATIIVARVQPGTSKGITDLLLPQPSSGFTTLAVPLVFQINTHLSVSTTKGCGHVRCFQRTQEISNLIIY